MSTFTAFLLCLFVLGCSGGPSGEQDPVVAGADADVPSPEPDAGLPPTELQETSIEDEASSCTQACQALGATCSESCEISGGNASYGYFDWDFGITRIVDTQQLSCQETVADSVNLEGEDYSLASLRCCCAVPPVTRVSGDVSSPQTCSTICEQAGYQGCGDFYDWQNGGTNGDALGGSSTQYVRSATGSVSYWVSPCDYLPTPTRTSGSVTRQLDDISCACHTP